ncbi:RraA family protein [Paracoccus actinidiae]|uniref:RraA family protein n=1 Tax=Paracoccus actinidiae TaxID=3064531 RepID=UPI0027D20BAB|nr:RraA family protein [Paracoccus sp. M09]
MTIDELIAGFKKTATANISDNLDRLPGFVGIRPYHRVNGTMVGRAMTIRVAAGDNLYVHKALDQMRPGDVLVVDAEGATNRAIIGEIITTLAETRGAAGFVIDGAIRDLGTIAANEFPCFAREVTHRGPYKFGPGAINIPVTIGGQVVNPGDIVVGDEDGVLSFPVEGAEDLLSKVRAHEAREVEILMSTSVQNPATRRRKTRPGGGGLRHGARAYHRAGACHGALAP